jgi:dTDP-4-amino-4,6-dideoxygalactose transaminase
MLRNHGRKHKYLHEKVGFNLRFNEIQAAVGREQLNVLDELNAGRRRAAEWYRQELAEVKGVTLPPPDGADSESVYHMFVIRLADHDAREALARALKADSIESGVHYPVPNHLQPAIVERFGPQPPLPRTEEFCKRFLSLPMFPAITYDEVRRVSTVVKANVR